MKCAGLVDIWPTEDDRVWWCQLRRCATEAMAAADGEGAAAAAESPAAAPRPDAAARQRQQPPATTRTKLVAMTLVLQVPRGYRETEDTKMCSPKLGEEYFGHSLSELTLSQVHEEAQLFMFNAVLPTTDKAHQGFTLTYETRVGGVGCQEIITAHLDLTNDRMWSMLKARHSHLYIKLKADPLVLDLLRNQGKPLSDIKKTKAAAMLNGIERMAVACQSQMTDDADYVPRVVELGGGKGRPPLPPPRQRSRSRSQSRARADDDDGDEEYDECDEGDDDDDAADDDDARSSDGGARGRGRGRSGGGRARAGRRGSSAARARGGRVQGGGGGGGSSGADDDSATENNSAERIEVAAWNKALLDNDNDATAALDSPEIRRIHKRPSLREKCIKSGVKLRNVGDDGHGIINPRFFWCGGCRQPRVVRLGKLNNLKAHLNKHHPQLGEVLEGTRQLSNMDDTNWESSPSAMAAFGATVRKFSASEWRREYAQVPGDVLSDFPEVASVLDLSHQIQTAIDDAAAAAAPRASSVPAAAEPAGGSEDPAADAAASVAVVAAVPAARAPPPPAAEPAAS